MDGSTDGTVPPLLCGEAMFHPKHLAAYVANPKTLNPKALGHASPIALSRLAWATFCLWYEGTPGRERLVACIYASSWFLSDTRCKWVFGTDPLV